MFCLVWNWTLLFSQCVSLWSVLVGWTANTRFGRVPKQEPGHYRVQIGPDQSWSWTSTVVSASTVMYRDSPAISLCLLHLFIQPTLLFNLIPSYKSSFLKTTYQMKPFIYRFLASVPVRNWLYCRFILFKAMLCLFKSHQCHSMQLYYTHMAYLMSDRSISLLKSTSLHPSTITFQEICLFSAFILLYWCTTAIIFVFDWAAAIVFICIVLRPASPYESAPPQADQCHAKWSVTYQG